MHIQGIRIGGKTYSISPSYNFRDGLSRTANTIDVTTPLRGVYTQSEYDALSDEERSKGAFLITDSMRVSGQYDLSPVGTVIAFMGDRAPNGYLACDGSTYRISSYPELASVLGNKYGGDGETTFAVPDMRNLFLRGYHGDSEDQLSGEIGEVQQATNHPYFGGNSAIWTSQTRTDLTPVNPDTVGDKASSIARVFLSGDTGVDIKNGYTSRPVNMAVLYCIKAFMNEIDSIVANNYADYEQRIGTWVDGRPLYRKLVTGTTHSTIETWKKVYTDTDMDTAVSIYGMLEVSSTLQYAIPQKAVSVSLNSGEGVHVWAGTTGMAGKPVRLIVEYTKLSDKPTATTSASQIANSVPEIDAPGVMSDVTYAPASGSSATVELPNIVQAPASAPASGVESEVK